MIRHRLLPALIMLALLASACGRTGTPTPTPTPTAEASQPQPINSTGVVISQVLAGVKGDNNHEFIELYNAGEQIVDLKGWTLWYRLPTSQEDLLVYRWKQSALIPPHGHFLLGHTGEELGIPADASFEQGLNTSSGGLSLRNAAKETIDSLGWGKAPAEFVEGQPAPALENDVSLVREPGGAEGNAQDTQNNAADFQLNDSPQPQNSGSPAAPAIQTGLAIQLAAPESVEPGGHFEYTLTVSNQGQQAAHNLKVKFPIPDKLEAASTPQGASLDQGILSWDLVALEAGASQSIRIPINVPWIYATSVARDYYVQADSGIAFGSPMYTRIEGGIIPIGTARTLMNAQLTVEGVATMYTGGYFAGSGNTKFYIQDDTGGLQVQVFGGEGKVQVPLGAKVQVRGTMGVYRGSLQIVPDVVPDDVQIVTPASQGQPWQATPVSIQQAVNDKETLPGKLVQVEGTVTRVEEFTYSYEIDLTDESQDSGSGQTLTLYVDKQTNIRVESIETGQLYRATGILEVYDDANELYPRGQSDLVEVFPPALMINGSAPNLVQPGEVFTTTLTVVNHTPGTLTGLQVSAPLPSQNASLDAPLDGGQQDGNRLTWNIPELAGEGGSLTLSYRLRAAQDAKTMAQIVSQGYQVTAKEGGDPATGPALRTFVGDNVPIWAIQGDGFRSPYVMDHLSTQGVVTGVFLNPPSSPQPGLGGFWIESAAPDDDPLTSEGLFVNTAGISVTVAAGDLVDVSGQVRELSQQTALQIDSPSDVVDLSHGNPLPSPVELNPPDTAAEAGPYYESLEGMLVKVSGPAIAVSPTSQYGEYVMVLPSHGVTRLWQGQDNGFAIMVDDGSSASYSDRSKMSYVVTTGDQVSDVEGPLAYSFGRYKIEPITQPQVQPADHPLEELQPTGTEEFSIMTWNADNLFDTRVPNPTDPPLPTREEYQLSLTKVANTILAAGMPTIVGLQEVENIGILQDLAATQQLAPYQYQPVLIEGSDSRGIDVGYLVRGDRAKILETKQYVAPEGLTSRPPLLIKVQVTTDQGPVTVYVINNHFLSMSGGELATEPRRTAQAAWNVTILQEILAEDPNAYVAIEGDLNSYYNSPPLDTLRQAGLKHVFEDLPADQRYTYIYEGESEALDHILVTPSLMDLIRRVQVLHVNADYPPMQPGDTSPVRKSDHDPLVATFSLAK